MALLLNHSQSNFARTEDELVRIVPDLPPVATRTSPSVGLMVEIAQQKRGGTGYRGRANEMAAVSRMAAIESFILMVDELIFDTPHQFIRGANNL